MKRGMVETVLMDLSNAYELLITKLLANAFINSQFKHAPMIWMFGNKSSIDKIFKIHKRTLQINYDVCDESYENPLNRSDNILIHQKQLRYFTIEGYKFLTKLNPEFMWTFFQRKHILYDLRRGDLLLPPPAKSTGCGVNSLAFRGSLVWNNFQSQITESQTLEEFNSLNPASRWQRQRVM